MHNFIGSDSSKEIVFVRGTTEAINLVANSYVKPLLSKGDNIIISQMEHHANIVPWQMITKENESEIRVIPMNENGELIVEKLEELIDENTKFISVTHVSNTLGTINPIKKIIDIAHKNNIRIMIDGAQAVQHMRVNVKEINADSFVSNIYVNEIGRASCRERV